MDKSHKEETIISVIGVRAFPSNFVGTSGLEVYVDKTVNNLLKVNRNLHFLIYTRKEYQPKKAKLPSSIKIKPLLTIRSKVLESLVYSFIASVISIFDESSVIWYHGVGPGFFFFLPRLFGKKVFITVHSLDWERRKWNQFERLLFRLGAYFFFVLNPKVTVVSKELKRNISKKFGITSSCTPPGIDLFESGVSRKVLKKFNLEKASYLLFLGRLVPEKRVEWLLETYLRLQKKFNGLKLVIAGGHGNLPSYEKKLKRKYENKDIIWTGYVFGKEKNSLLHYSLCFVLPSELEGSSISLNEAISAGKLCVVSSNCVPSDFKFLDNLFMFKKGSKILFYEALLKAVEAQKTKYVYTEEEQKILDKFSWMQTANIFNSLVSKL